MDSVLNLEILEKQTETISEGKNKMNLSGMLSDSVGLVSDIIKDIEGGIAKGGGVMAESVVVAEALWADASFKAHIVALIADIKG